jgi:hypothetical protein
MRAPIQSTHLTWKDIERLDHYARAILSGVNWQHAFVAVQGHTVRGPM